MSLKENCRERIFSVIEKITEISRYVIMVVDKNAYKILSMICKNEELLERGVSLIELIDTKRNSLQDFDCIYFISSNIQSVDMILNDFKDENNSKYKNIHILFTSNIGKNSEILDLLATNDFMLKKIKSCACINLNFLAYESRIFYFENNLNLYDYYPLKNSGILFEISSKLLSVCSCLKICPQIRYQNSDLCRKFSEIFYNNMKTSDTARNKGPSDDLILILDRSIDSSILFIHDYSYQSLCYDILKINTQNDEEAGTREGKEKEEAHTVSFEITNNDQKKEQKKAVLSEDDSLWLKYRHSHIQEVNEHIRNEISAFTEKNAVAKIQKKNILNPNEALDALRSLPQYESMIEQYWLHVYLCDSCFIILQNKSVVDVGLIEQDICCNVDKYGKELTHSKNVSSLNSLITSTDYDQEEKARLLLLYFINYMNINENDKMKIIESAQLGLFMQKFINEFLKLKLHLNYMYIDENLSSSNRVYHILDKNKKKIKYYKNVARNSKYELSRHEPNIREIILEIHENILHKGLFPFVDDNNNIDPDVKDINSSPEKKQNVSRGTVWEFRTELKKKAEDEKKKKIIIFIIGGISFPEIKHIYELSEKLDLDIYLGGTALLTSNIIFKQFKAFSNF
ncbi:syntaxin-binding protein [Plasmodium brasilianum]|uniref:Syntaxin binding protein, putative n=2 Tax=Plasmodium (Plasmodium) TaxID=418103 RepID=A0A1A8X182_PLAMA|nr:syntaxin binding protein, putative [Plasmodium malariae]KAI4837361.1 syntaxin-binding protein [Plasmodium brasilianum]SBS97921.1 syntaxin binding protein, putative [Plasmodium malariae]SCO93242.1 syntaxin binding protein, putative [Plasmodium malariae]